MLALYPPPPPHPSTPPLTPLKIFLTRYRMLHSCTHPPLGGISHRKVRQYVSSLPPSPTPPLTPTLTPLKRFLTRYRMLHSCTLPLLGGISHRKVRQYVSSLLPTPSPLKSVLYSCVSSISSVSMSWYLIVAIPDRIPLYFAKPKFVWKPDCTRHDLNHVRWGVKHKLIEAE